MPVVDVDPAVARRRLEEADIAVTEGNTEHEQWRAETDDAVAVAYDDSVVIQGQNPQRLQAVISDTAGRAHLYFDGASRGNPGPAAVGWVIVTSDGIVAEGSDTIGTATNNQAEYQALIAGLEVASEYGFDELQIRGDSELIIKQIRGEYQVSDPTLREHRVTAHELLSEFSDWELTHVPREVNNRADSLANEALDHG
ncbi:ribonuclease HI family protein [Salinarchaeum sp. IM2453]|uniref:ribonuclease HI n=1 Tax=Salinarchaeum sp. IM2453 TaxID=2862870 RepID=UPI001C83A46F|nr:ribonuclease HI [Salinarchaeum sp. IM2453]QZA88953.1 ribonuclease HI family protein [Salinarchaeum sp. IM2453]